MSLALLPVELVELICENCSVDEIKALRLTCRHMHNVAKDYLFPALIKQYELTAQAVNERDWNAFVKGVRERWTPYPEDEWEWRYHDGYTDEGAFALWVHRLAFHWAWNSWSDFQRKPVRDHAWPLCAAEEYNEVILHVPIDSLKDEIPMPLADPRPEEEIADKLAKLKNILQRQVADRTGSDNISIELPKQFERLMRITNGIAGAGIPAEIEHLQLVHGLPLEYDAKFLDHDLRAIPRYYEAVAAWMIGGDSACQDPREIYYILCRYDLDAPRWRIVKKVGIEWLEFESLAKLIQEEMDCIKDRQIADYSHALQSGYAFPME